MAPRGERSARTLREMDRGRAMVERATRVELIEKWEKDHSILVMYPKVMYPKEFLANQTYGDRDVLVSIGKQTFREPARQFPGVQMIADIYLALEFGK
jgi:hypothetical protein